MVDVILNRQSNVTNAPQMYLYDYGQELHIIGKLPDNCEAHYSFTENYTDRSNIRPITKTSDGGIVAIPNSMFQAENLLSHNKYKFYVYLFDLEDEDSARTFHKINVVVVERPLPDDYVPDPDLPYINIIITQLQEKIALLETQLAETNENLGKLDQEVSAIEGLPDVTASDDGKVLLVDDGEWNPAEAPLGGDWNATEGQNGYIANKPTPDATLSEARQAADAKAVGDALSLKQDTLTFDEEPIAGSLNPVTSAGLFTALADKLPNLPIASYPSDELLCLISSKGVYDALLEKQNVLEFDDVPMVGSGNPVKSGGIYSELEAIRNMLNRFPEPTEDDGTYVFKCDVVDGEITYYWHKEPAVVGKAKVGYSYAGSGDNWSMEPAMAGKARVGRSYAN